MNASTQPGEAFDAPEFLTRQHREVEQIWAELQAAHTSRSGAQADLARRLVTLLSQHDAIETRLLYPELRKVGGEHGRERSDHSLDEHQVVRELLVTVDGADPADDRVFDVFSKCMAGVVSHVAEEEGDVFPVLRDTVPERRLVELGERMASMMATAPTRPHPTTPSSKVGATIAGAVNGVIDRARDALRRSA